jgi:hypothetical protein
MVRERQREERGTLERETVVRCRESLIRAKKLNNREFVISISNHIMVMSLCDDDTKIVLCKASTITH